MKHISEILKKRTPPKKGKAKPRRPQGKKGATARKVVVPDVEVYASLGRFTVPKEPKRKKTKTNPDGAGRPTVMTPEVIGKLEVAFTYDATVEEACLEAGISQSSYYDFVKLHPTFTERIDALRQAPKLIARKKVVQTMQHDADLSLKYLERKNKQEFSTRTEVAHSGEVVNKHHVDPEQAALIKQAMGGFARKMAKLAEAKK